MSFTNKPSLLARCNLYIVGLFFSFIMSLPGLVLAANSQNQFQLIKPVESKKVCMVTNKYMGAEQIPVLVGEKTYYGCCAGCASKLQNDENIRSSTDPMSGESVDKASAFIATKSDSNQVLYFKSQDTYYGFLKNSGIPGWMLKYYN